MRIKRKYLISGLVGVIAVTLILISFRNKSFSEEYLISHPEILKSEGKRCLKKAETDHRFPKDKNCMLVVTIESKRCYQQTRIGFSFYQEECNNSLEMIVLAANGF